MMSCREIRWQLALGDEDLDLETWPKIPFERLLDVENSRQTLFFLFFLASFSHSLSV